MNYRAYRPRQRRTKMYSPEQASTKINVIVAVVAFSLFGAAAWYSLTSTLDSQQRYHCNQGWQPACEKLK